MATIKPFCGYRYNPDIITSPGDVMAPPYDSLSDEQTDEYFEISPHNAVRLIAQRTYDTDSDTDNCYIRSKNFLKNWIETNILIQDEKKSLYIYEQTITINREKYYNRGIIGLLELTDYSDGKVVPCENPSTDSLQDRFNMIKEIEANSSLISCMYTERDKPISALYSQICESKATMEFTTPNDGILHKLWKIDDEETVSFIQNELSGKKLFIVDGHNRYEACLEYKNKQKNKPGYTGKESFNYIMALISDNREDGRIQLPVHRLLSNEKNFNENFIIAGLQDTFHIEKIIVDKMDDDFSETLRKQISTQRKETIFAMYTGEDYFYRFTFTKPEYLKTVMPEASDIYRTLDINIINKLIFEEQLGMDPETDSQIEFTRSLNDGVKAVDTKEYNCLFALNPVRSWQFEALTETGERLPKRSVSIFPKPATGIVIHKFTEEI